MKITRIKFIEIANRPILKGLELKFSYDKNLISQANPNVFIGINGSGKSQVLESISDIFLYLEKLYRKANRIVGLSSPMLFEIEYYIIKERELYKVSINQINKKAKLPDIKIFNSKEEEILISIDDIHEYLPSKVIGYTSGDNETLSIPFMSYYDEYAEFTARRALLKDNIKQEDYDPIFYFMDYNTNKGVVISNSILSESGAKNRVLEAIGLKGLKSFQIIIQTKHKAARGKEGIQLTNELKNWINQLLKSATCYKYFPIEEKYILDFFNNEATKDAIKYYFNSPLGFYTALYKIELLNNLIIEKSERVELEKQRRLRKRLIKTPSVPDKDKVLNYSEIKLQLLDGEVIDYLCLSDGEHQFLNIFGTLLMSDFENSLFLLDEPETHFNPKWRREFISILNDIANGRNQDFFITSHSPFIVADSQSDKVYIYRKEKNSLKVEWPIKETFGSSFDYILKIAFDLENTLSKKSSDEIELLIQSTDVELIKNRLGDFGDSPEKFILYRHLESLQSKK